MFRNGIATTYMSYKSPNISGESIYSFLFDQVSYFISCLTAYSVQIKLIFISFSAFVYRVHPTSPPFFAIRPSPTFPFSSSRVHVSTSFNVKYLIYQILKKTVGNVLQPGKILQPA